VEATLTQPRATPAQRQFVLEQLGGRPIVLVGMMGAGKTTVGRRLATHLGLAFVDSDSEIEKAAGMRIEEIFDTHGEAEFRAGEARVVARILKSRDIVVATGGGVLLNSTTAELIRAEAVSVWLKADTDLLFSRVSRRDHRPLLKTDNPRKTLEDLIEARYPYYSKADATVISRDIPHDHVAEQAIMALSELFYDRARAGT
jgi:shikimate kinase